ncbi:MAG: hypothetical protein C5B44_05815 [Acidobacteria bacterium]|nr:MAG: hypothetical protein C5B44_05815 [Acidobacteriota bacterium]
MGNAVLLRKVPRLLASALMLVALASITIVQAQVPEEKPAGGDPITGKFEGVVKSTPGTDTRLTLELLNDKGKIAGRLITPQGVTEISEATFAGGKLTVKLGKDKPAGTITAKLQDDNLIGEWVEGEQKRSIELKRVGTVGGDSAPVPVRADPFSLAGEWDALADAQGQGFPFSLILKLDGEKVTGESNSSLGLGTISNGTWKDGRLSFQIDTPSGPVVMSAVIKDGGLVGEYDYTGQVQGRWVAKKKTP